VAEQGSVGVSRDRDSAKSVQDGYGLRLLDGLQSLPSADGIDHFQINEVRRVQIEAFLRTGRDLEAC